MNRRTFLLSSACAARVLGANDRVNIGVIGVGGRGNYHVQSLCRRADTEVAAVCDVDTGRIERAVQSAYSAGRNRAARPVDQLSFRNHQIGIYR